jgi:hypothetical protein
LLVGIGVKSAELGAYAAFEPPGSADESLEREDAGLFLIAVRQELFFASDLRVAVQVLEAARAFPSRARRLRQLDATFAALAEESRADLARVFDFVVTVV